MKSKFSHIGLAKLCEWFGITRQAYYQHNWDEISTNLEEELVIQRVIEIRKKHRVMGTRKLYEMLQPFLIEHQIKTVLSLPEAQEIHVQTNDLFTNTEHLGIVDQMVLEAMENNESLKIAKEDLDLKQLDKKITKANVLPKITAGGEYGLNYPNFMFFPPEEHLYRFGMVGVNITVPLSNFFKNKQKMQIADQKIEIAKLEIEEREEQITHEVFTAKKRLDESLDKIKIAEEAIHQSKENYRIVKTKYANKLSLITELIDADNAYLEAQSNLISLQINKQLKYYQLQYVLGNL